MKEKIKQKCRRKSNNGITLIALVITIIVLLILATVTILALTGDNGLFTKAREARTATGVAEEREQITLAVNASWDIDGELRPVLTKANLQKIQGATVEGDNFPFTVTYTKTGNCYIVENDMEITEMQGEIKLSVEEIETESRAVRLKVTVLEVPTVEDWLRTFSTEEITEMYARIMTNGNRTWAQTVGGNGYYTDVKDFYEKTVKPSGRYRDEYDWMANATLYVDIDAYKQQYEKTTLKCNNETIKVSTGGEFIISTNGRYTVTATNEEGKRGSLTKKITKCVTYGMEEKYSDIQQSNYKFEKDGYEVWIPAGFAYGTSSNVGTVTTGLVITDNVDDNHNSIGNEFVWIPVDKTNLTVGKTTKKMAEISSGNDYRGVLYDWNSNNSGNITITPTATGRREPDVVSYDTGDYVSKGITKSGLQSEYNLMIDSIKQYGGFYVSRYEMAIENGNIFSKVGAKLVFAGNWYECYNKMKTYTNSKNSVSSEMMWGSQFDAILNFALSSGNDGAKVNQQFMDGYRGNRAGIRTSDSINNIFDLGGNEPETTLEAFNGNYRTIRGTDSDNSEGYTSYRYCWEPDDAAGLTSHFSLYIK